MTSPPVHQHNSRLSDELLGRSEDFAHRVVDLAESLESAGKSRRVVDQLIGSGTSVAANLFEAAEALSRKDFCKLLGISIKEANETRFWIRFVLRRGWVDPSRLDGLEQEALELKRILGSMLARTRARDNESNSRPQ